MLFFISAQAMRRVPSLCSTSRWCLKEETFTTVVSMRRISRNLALHLDRHRPHGVFDVRPFDARVEPVAHLVLVAMQLANHPAGQIESSEQPGGAMTLR